MVPIIVLAGKAGVGKSTVAEMIAAMVPQTEIIAFADPIKRIVRDAWGFSEATLWGPSQAREVLIPSFLEEDRLRLVDAASDAMLGYGIYRFAVEWVDMVLEEGKKAGGVSARMALQTLGTDIGRRHHKDIWVHEARFIADELLKGGFAYDPKKGLIESDRAANLVVIQDGRFRNEILGVKAAGGEAWAIRRPTSSSSTHESEVELEGIPDFFYGSLIYNTDSLDTLEREVQALLDRTLMSPLLAKEIGPDKICR